MVDRMRENVARLIRESGVGDQELAHVFGVNRSNVCRWRAGKSAPSGARLVAFLAWSETDLHQLAYGTPAPRSHT